MNEFGPASKTITVPVQTFSNRLVVTPEDLKHPGVDAVLGEVRAALLQWAEGRKVNLIADTERLEIQVCLSVRGVECPEEIEWEKFRKNQIRSDRWAFTLMVPQESEVSE